MLRFMLDTNSVSYALKGNPPSVREHLRQVPKAQVCISSITEAELLFGLALKPQATKLAELVKSIPLGRQRSALGLRSRKSLCRPVLRLLEAGPPPRRHGHARRRSRLCLRPHSRHQRPLLPFPPSPPRRPVLTP